MKIHLEMIKKCEKSALSMLEMLKNGNLGKLSNDQKEAYIYGIESLLTQNVQALDELIYQKNY